jgi:hypothetical protein
VGWLATAVVAGVLFRCLGSGGKERGAGRSQDRFCRTMLATDPHREARAWLAESKQGDERNLGEKAVPDSRQIVETLYRLGATDVQAIDVQRQPGWGESTNRLIVALPDDPGRRRELLAYGEELASSQGFDGVPDEGQRYMFLYKFKLGLRDLLRRLR